MVGHASVLVSLLTAVLIAERVGDTDTLSAEVPESEFTVRIFKPLKLPLSTMPPELS